MRCASQCAAHRIPTQGACRDGGRTAFSKTCAAARAWKTPYRGRTSVPTGPGNSYRERGTGMLLDTWTGATEAAAVMDERDIPSCHEPTQKIDHPQHLWQRDGHRLHAHERRAFHPDRDARDEQGDIAEIGRDQLSIAVLSPRR